VPSSTSSSELWRRTWFATLALVVVVLTGWEVFWRLEGFAPEINNDENLWALARSRAARAGRDGVLLIGSSRLQVGIDADAFSRATGWQRPIQLAIAMGPSIPVLRDLSRDPRVSQRVVCGVHPTIFFDETRQLDGIAVRYADRYAAFTPADEIEAGLRTLTQRSLVSSLPALFPHHLIDALRTGQRPQLPHTTFDVERFGRSDLRRMGNLGQLRRANQRQWRSWKGRPASPAKVTETVVLVGRFVAEIRKHGGDVVFVRMPTSGYMRRREHELIPRVEYWDVFAAEIDAVTIHFEDHAELRGFATPDGEHLDQRETASFSDALGTVLLRELARRERESAPREPPTPFGA